METTSNLKVPPKVRVITGAAAVLLGIAIGIFAFGSPKATTMHLLRTAGTVSVYDGEDKVIKPREKLGLYSGYNVETEPVSYAWIDLDEVKLVKMDEASEIEIQKDGKKLELLVNSGSLFFNVSEPLAGDEIMNICTSTMVVGIRGTCGWVVSEGDKGAQVYILEGKVEVEAVNTEETAAVSAGEMAQVSVTEEGETEITVQPFAEEYIAPFVLSELEEEDSLSAAVLAASGLDVRNPPDPAERLKAEYEEIVASRPILDPGAAEGTSYTVDDVVYADEGLSYAICADLNGDGAEELLLLTQKAAPVDDNPFTRLEVYGAHMGRAALYDEEGSEEILGNEFALLSNGENFCMIFNYFNDWYQTEGDSATYVLEDETIKLASISYLGDRPGWNAEDYSWEDWMDSEDEADARNFCPAIPDDTRWKTELLCVVNEGGEYENHNYAKLADIDRDGEEEMYLLSDDFCVYDWDGTQIQSTVLESNVSYAKLIDMDQDGKEELLLIKTEGDRYIPNYLAKVYSLDETGAPNNILELNYNILTDGVRMAEFGLYREKTTGNVYLGGESNEYETASKDAVFNSLTDSVKESFWIGSAGGLILSEEDLNQIEAENDRRWNEYMATVNRFDLIEDIDTNSWEWQESLAYTVDEVRQQLMAR